MPSFGLTVIDFTPVTVTHSTKFAENQNRTGPEEYFQVLLQLPETATHLHKASCWN